MRVRTPSELAWLLGLGALGWGVWALRPRPVPVDVVRVERGAVRVTVSAEGRTAVRERYLVAMPVGGTVARQELHAGDAVEQGRTVLAVIAPTVPELLDERAQAVASARLKAAQAAEEAAQAAVEKARVALLYEQQEVERRAPLARTGALASQELQEHQQRLSLAEADVKAAGIGVRVAAFEREQAEAALRYASPRAADSGSPARLEVRSPVTGRVLRVLRESEGSLAAGTPLLEVADLAWLEVEADLLTRDAVRVAVGAPVVLDEWGGARPLEGRVRQVEPAAFTKVSALGVEEQRVTVRIDLGGPPEARAGLGQAFRVQAHVVVEDHPDVLRVPTGALFRSGDGWAAFRVESDRARLVRVTAGASDGRHTQVLAGLAEGERLVAYPTDRVEDGARVEVVGP